MNKEKVVIVGAEVMGASLAQVYAKAGYKVILCEE
jgi:3-hydroxyacyl-CoA dehydrogenase